jgi:formate hydrogenlyase transcriptional activator
MSDKSATEPSKWGQLATISEVFSDLEQLLAAYFSSPDVGLAICDDQLRFQAINDALAAMNGIPAEAHLGKTIREVLGDFASNVEPAFRRVLATGQALLGSEITGQLPTRTEVGHWVESYFPIKDATGRVKQVAAMVVEATKQKKLEEALDNLSIRLQRETNQLQALLEISKTLASKLGLPQLFSAISGCLRKAINQNFASVALADETHQFIRVYELDYPSAEGLVSRDEVLPLDEVPGGDVFLLGEANIFNRADLGEFHSSFMDRLLKLGVQSGCCIPLITPKGTLGTLNLWSIQENAFVSQDVGFLKQVATEVALAVENSLTQKALQQERDRLHLLLELNSTLATNRDLQKLLPALSGFMQRMIRHDYASVAVYNQAAHSLFLYPLDSPLMQGLVAVDSTLPVKETPAGHALLERETKIFSREDLVEIQSSYVSQMLEKGIQSLCCIPLITRKGELGTLNLASKEKNAFDAHGVGLLQQVAAQVAIALDNARAYREIAELTDKLAKEKLYLEDEIRSELNFEEIVGESAALKRSLSQARTVAPSNATALILGETGTGKELVARAIHRMSSRKEGSFIKLNCAAIPTGLLESELFGHEKGAFTGAISQKVGRLELADKGTLFLDEVGDIPLELQPKLLRVLQDQEFERLGSTRTIRVDIRLIAATNRDLAESVSDREFRSDLYYRLNVFPIRMPALREREGDIPLLVRYFVQKLARRMNKPIETIPTATMNALVGWKWPGNVRELENFIERSVILSEGKVLHAPLAELRPSTESSLVNGTLESLERQHIIRVLRETGGLIAGARGAAAKLGLKRTTLQSRILKLGISHEEYEAPRR